MEQISLFGEEPVLEDITAADDAFDLSKPLASRLRPRELNEYVGQSHLIGKGRLLRNMIESDKLSSMIFWGPPGVGKTTLARLIAGHTKSEFLNFSAVTGGMKEIKEVMAGAAARNKSGKRTVMFVDEIHRFNKAQQDAFLPYVENGTIVLIGATTENPSFEINSALLSRCKVFVLNALTKEEIEGMIRHALTDDRGFGTMKVSMDDECIAFIAAYADGDARTALNTLEMAVLNGNLSEDASITVTKEIIEQCVGKKALLYDKDGEEHYNLISALHKSMRNSDPDAAVYWLARMLEAGEDPLYVARRIVRFAAEDVGLGDPHALPLAVSAYQATHFIGMPECNAILSEAVLYLALAPKTNTAEKAYFAARDDAQKMLSEPVPLNIRNGVTGLMKDLGYGKGYVYAHDTEEKMARMNCMPESIKDHVYYEPTDQGLEAQFAKRLEEIKAFKNGEPK